MPITIITSRGRETLEAPDGVDPEDEIERIKNGEGEYASGWLVVRRGAHIRISDILEMRAFRGRQDR